MANIILSLALGFIIGYLIAYCRKIYLNRGYTKRNQSNGIMEVEPVSFLIKEVKEEHSFNNYNPTIAKYTARVWFNNKNNVDYETVFFFDEVGKYNIGDKLTFTK